MHQTFENQYVTMTLFKEPCPASPLMTLHATVHNPQAYSMMTCIAAAPSTRIASYAGSALPHSSPMAAFDHTPNNVEVPHYGSLVTEFLYPGSYYTWDGATKVPPSVYFLLIPKSSKNEPIYIQFALEDPHPLRTLTHRAQRLGPEFYHKADVVGVPPSQEALLRDMQHIKTFFNVA
jgi:hypothetical protein